MSNVTQKTLVRWLSPVSYTHLYWVVQFALLYNAYTLAIPQYLIFTKMGIIDTLWVYILPYLPLSLIHI